MQYNNVYYDIIYNIVPLFLMVLVISVGNHLKSIFVLRQPTKFNYYRIDFMPMPFIVYCVNIICKYLVVGPACPFAAGTCCVMTGVGPLVWRNAGYGDDQMDPVDIL